MGPKRSSEQFVSHLAAVIRYFSNHLFVKPDVYLGGIAGIARIIELAGKFFACCKAAVHADKLHQIDD
jgi:hypothetical protein